MGAAFQGFLKRRPSVKRPPVSSELDRDTSLRSYPSDLCPGPNPMLSARFVILLFALIEDDLSVAGAMVGFGGWGRHLFYGRQPQPRASSRSPYPYLRTD
jgi:hypothetical protein